MSSQAPSVPHAEADLHPAGMAQPYHLVDPSPWPLFGALGAGMMLSGIVLAAHFGNYILLTAGVLTVLTVATLWWRDVWKESRVPGLHGPVVRLGLRYGMLFFITSEVMFFVAFFWAFFHFALYPEHVAGAAVAQWPPAGVHTFDPFRLPFMNTMILLLSGCTVTWAHHALLEGDRRGLIMGLGITVLLGMSFTTFQAIEYSDAPFKFNGGGIYPSVFFLATGFHGFHVIVGTIFLAIWLVPVPQWRIHPRPAFRFRSCRLVLAFSSMWSGCSCSCASIGGARALTLRNKPVRWRRLLWPGVMTAAMLVVLLGLGSWQLRRLAWKTDLLDRIAAAEAAPSVPLGEDPRPFTKIAISGVFRRQDSVLYGASVRETRQGPDHGGRTVGAARSCQR